MKQNFAFATLMTASLALSACNKSNGSQPPPPPPPAPAAPAAAAVPYGFTEDLRGEATAAVTLTAEQKTSIVKIMDQKNVLQFMDQMYFKNYDDMTDGEEQKKHDLKHLNKHSIRLYKMVVDNCTPSTSAPTITGALNQGQGQPAPSPTPANGQNQTQTIEVDRTLGGDSSCPVSLSSRDVTTITSNNITSAPQANGPVMQTTTYVASEDITTTENISDPTLLTNANTISSQKRETKIDSNYAAFQFISGGSVLGGTAHVRTVNTSDNALVSGQTFKSTLKSETSITKTERHMELLYKLEFSDGKKLVIGAFNDNGTLSIYVNGQAYTPQALKTDYKLDLSVSMSYDPLFVQPQGVQQ